MENKLRWRRKLKEQRADLESNLRIAWNERICRRLVSYLENNSYKHIFSFRSYGSEVDINSTTDLLSQRFHVALPRCSAGGKMDFYTYQFGDELELNKWGIAEPKPLELVTPCEDSVVLVPALAISNKGQRLGYGGGFYDRYLARFPHLLKIGVIYEMFYAFALEAEDHDVALDIAIHQSGIEDFRSRNA